MAKSFAIAVKWIIRNPEGKYLVLFKSNQEDVNPSDFDLPGWRIQRWEELEDALIREVNEETWVEIKIEKFTRRRSFTQWDLHIIWVTFLAFCKDREYLILSWEHDSFKRKTKNEIIDWKYPARLKEEFKKI